MARTMGNRRQPADIKRKNMDFKVLKRVLGYMMKRYKFRFILVLVCILITAATTLIGMLFMQSLIDDFITPMLDTVKAGGEANFGPLLARLCLLAGIYVVGIVASFTYNTYDLHHPRHHARSEKRHLHAHGIPADKVL